MGLVRYGTALADERVKRGEEVWNLRRGDFFSANDDTGVQHTCAAKQCTKDLTDGSFVLIYRYGGHSIAGNEIDGNAHFNTCSAQKRAVALACTVRGDGRD
jgi:hypothetical protein